MKKTLSQLKKDLHKGVKLLCLEHSQKSDYVGLIREVNITQTNAFTLLTEKNGAMVDSWLWYPKASMVDYEDDVFTVYEDFSQYGGNARQLLYSYKILNN